MIDQTFYDKDYYENGIQTGKSCYQNYIWLPELTIPMAMSLIDYLGITRKHMVLDLGCSKGYLVKALRMLHRMAWGADVSEYALSQVPEDVKIFCHKTDILEHMTFDYCIAKDVFEHIPVEELRILLKTLKSKELFAVIPLGKNGKYYADSNNLDKSHIVCEDDLWWKDFFKENGWELIDFSYKMDGMKENYLTIPKAHGFFRLHNLKQGCI
jgi:SAM-dependent methyltransferase